MGHGAAVGGVDGVVGGKEAGHEGEVAAGGGSVGDDAGGVEVVFGGVFVDPGEGAADVLHGGGGEGNVGEAVVDADYGEAHVEEGVEAAVFGWALALPPSSAVPVDDYGGGFGVGLFVDVYFEIGAVDGAVG